MAQTIARDGSVGITGKRPVVDTAAYATGDLIGGKLTFDNMALKAWGRGGLIQSICLADRAKQNSNVDIVIFGSDPTGTTFTDQVALVVADADLDKIIAVVSLTSYADFSANSFAGASGLAIPYITDATDDIYVAIVSRGAPTYVAATDLFLTISTVYG